MARKAPPKTRARCFFSLESLDLVAPWESHSQHYYVRRHPVTSKTFAVSALIRKSIPLPLLPPNVSREKKITAFPTTNTNTYLLVELKTKYSNRVMLTARVIDIYPPNTNIFPLLVFEQKSL